MDENQVEKLGISPIADDLAKAQSISSLSDFTALLGQFESRGLGGFLSGWVTADAADPTTNIAYIYQGGISSLTRRITAKRLMPRFVAH